MHPALGSGAPFDSGQITSYICGALLELGTFTNHWSVSYFPKASSSDLNCCKEESITIRYDSSNNLYYVILSYSHTTIELSRSVCMFVCFKN